MLPESKHVADHVSSSVGEEVITHSSPGSITKNFETSFVGAWTSYQSHCKITHFYWKCLWNNTITRYQSINRFWS